MKYLPYWFYPKPKPKPEGAGNLRFSRTFFPWFERPFWRWLVGLRIVQKDDLFFKVWQFYHRTRRLLRVARGQARRRENELLEQRNRYRGLIHSTQNNREEVEKQNRWLKENAAVFDRDLKSFRRELETKNRRIAELEKQLKTILGLDEGTDPTGGGDRFLVAVEMEDFQQLKPFLPYLVFYFDKPGGPIFWALATYQPDCENFWYVENGCTVCGVERVVGFVEISLLVSHFERWREYRQTEGGAA